LEGTQIRDVIERVLDVESQAREIVTRAEREAREITARAKEEARRIGEEARHTILEESHRVAQRTLDEARRLRDERIAREMPSDERTVESRLKHVPAAVERVVREIARS